MSELYRHIDLVSENEPPFGAFAPNAMQTAIMAFARIPPFYRGTFRRPMANLVRRTGHHDCIDVRSNGSAFRVRKGANLIEDTILIHPAYNRTEISFLLKGTPVGGTFIDLGANIGLYSLPLAQKAGPEGHVLAIDANPDIVKALEFNIAASGLSNVTVACVAAGSENGMVHLEIRKDDLAIIHTREDPAGEIPMRPLLDIVRDAGINHVDTLKADIEGFEDRAIPPFLDATGPEFHPSRIVIEHTGRAQWNPDCFTVFERHGYKLVGTTRNNAMFEKEVEQSARQVSDSNVSVVSPSTEGGRNA